MNYINKGEKYGRLTALENAKLSTSRINFICDCGISKNLAPGHIKRGRTKSCGCLVKENFGSKSFSWKGGRYISSRYYSRIIQNCKRSSQILDFNLTIEYLDKLWESQNGLCAYTKWNIYLSDRKNKATASLDRINPNLGYVIGNVHFVHKDVNEMKWNFQEKYFLEMCKAIVEKFD